MVANLTLAAASVVFPWAIRAEEDKWIMAAVARHALGLVEGTATSNVIILR
jgi:hypothetical protein